MSRFVRRAALLGALLMAVLPAGLAPAQATAPRAETNVGARATAPVPARRAPRNTTLVPAPLPASSVLPNSMRGQYAWLGAESQVAGWPAPDMYYRDQVYWGRLERSRGTYDFRWIEDGLRRAEERGGRFGFRVMAYCPGCWMNYRDDKTNFPAVTPDFLPLQTGTDVPDWNSETFLSAWEDLFAELGRRYGHDPRIGWVDVGGYGMYGEWHVTPGEPEITDANATRLIRAVLNAFPDRPAIVNAMVPRLANLAVSLSPRVGLRSDCLGEYQMWSILPTAPSLQQVWRHAPVLTEWCGSLGTSTVAGAEQVKQYHVSMTSSGNLKKKYADMSAAEQAGYLDAMRSAGYRYRVSSVRVPRRVKTAVAVPVRVRWRQHGSAPTYDRWQVSLQLRNSAGVSVWSQPLATDLRTVTIGTVDRTENLAFNVPPGSYQLRLVVADPSGYLAPMYLGMQGRAADGSYPIGKLRIRG